jgi:hypothetical protein
MPSSDPAIWFSNALMVLGQGSTNISAPLPPSSLLWQAGMQLPSGFHSISLCYLIGSLPFMLLTPFHFWFDH